MARQIDSVDILGEYVRGVMERASHHAGNVIDVIPQLVAEIIQQHDPETLQCRTYRAKLANILRFAVNSRTYALRYDHNSEQIELRSGNEHGSVVARFSNADGRQQVQAVFRSL